MMFTYLIFYAVADHALSDAKNFLLTCFIFLAIGMFFYYFSEFSNKISWSLTITPVYALIMLCGSAIARRFHEFKFRVIPAILAALVHACLYKFFGSPDTVYNELGLAGVWSVPIFIAQTFIGGYSLIALCEFLTRYRKLAELLKFIGRNSFSFLLLHCVFGVIFADIMHTYIKPGPYWFIEVTPEIFVKSLIGWLLSMICCSVFCVLKERLE